MSQRGLSVFGKPFFIAYLSGPVMKSKLPDVGTSIFSVMSNMARAEGALNLSQGFPDFPSDPDLIDRVSHYMKAGKNQYPPMQGIPELREIIAKQLYRKQGVSVNPDSEVNVTSGATQAIYTAITAAVGRGDEVIIFTPAYDCYAPAIELNGGKVVSLPLAVPEFKIDFEALKQAITPRTRMIMVNTPHNPSGALVSREEWEQLADMVRDTDILILSDEVYEHIVFDEHVHCSALSIPGLRERTFAVSSFGKTFHVTGWKMGYCLAAPALMAEFRKCHQFIVFTSHSPSQFALADYMQRDEKIDSLGAFYQQKRDLFLAFLDNTAFTYHPAAGTYFQLLNYDKLSQKPDVVFAEEMTRESKLASIPISVFYDDNRDAHYLRFCFAKDDTTLKRAGEILNQIGKP